MAGVEKTENSGSCELCDEFDSRPATHHCENCMQNFCKRCKRVHQKLRICRYHKVVELPLREQLKLQGHDFFRLNDHSLRRTISLLERMAVRATMVNTCVAGCCIGEFSASYLNALDGSVRRQRTTTQKRLNRQLIAQLVYTSPYSANAEVAPSSKTSPAPPEPGNYQANAHLVATLPSPCTEEQDVHRCDPSSSSPPGGSGDKTNSSLNPSLAGSGLKSEHSCLSKVMAVMVYCCYCFCLVMELAAHANNISAETNKTQSDNSTGKSKMAEGYGCPSLIIAAGIVLFIILLARIPPVNRLLHSLVDCATFVDGLKLHLMSKMIKKHSATLVGPYIYTSVIIILLHHSKMIFTPLRDIFDLPCKPLAAVSCAVMCVSAYFCDLDKLFAHPEYFDFILGTLCVIQEAAKTFGFSDRYRKLHFLLSICIAFLCFLDPFFAYLILKLSYYSQIAFSKLTDGLCICWCVHSDWLAPALLF